MEVAAGFLRHGKMALNLWTGWEEAMADASAQAATINSLIYLHTAAGRGEIKDDLADSGDMWIASAGPIKHTAWTGRFIEVSAWSYQRPLAVGE
jgi:hypothetical protein